MTLSFEGRWAKSFWTVPGNGFDIAEQYEGRHVCEMNKQYSSKALRTLFQSEMKLTYLAQVSLSMDQLSLHKLQLKRFSNAAINSCPRQAPVM